VTSGVSGKSISADTLEELLSLRAQQQRQHMPLIPAFASGCRLVDGEVFTGL